MTKSLGSDGFPSARAESFAQQGRKGAKKSAARESIGSQVGNQQ
jgi:hypothetical protein